jgi:DNA-binding CsgD family transcriptional regulator
VGIEINAVNTGRNLIFQAQSSSLKPVELMILDLRKNGASKEEIADELGLSFTEVSKRLKAIERKVKIQGSAVAHRGADRGPA